MVFCKNFLVVFAGQHFPGFGAVAWANNTFFFHDLDHTGRPVISYPQPPLHHGNRSLAGFTHQGHGLIRSAEMHFPVRCDQRATRHGEATDLPAPIHRDPLAVLRDEGRVAKYSDQQRAGDESPHMGPERDPATFATQ